MFDAARILSVFLFVFQIEFFEALLQFSNTCLQMFHFFYVIRRGCKRLSQGNTIDIINVLLLSPVSSWHSGTIFKMV